MKEVITINNRKIELSKSTIENAKLLEALKKAHASRERIRIFYGDLATGKSWNEENDVTGVLSNSTGETAVLILISRITSSGGGAILDSAIVRIQTKNEALYSHENFHTTLEQKENKLIDTTDNGIFASCLDSKKAARLLKFFKGENFGK